MHKDSDLQNTSNNLNESDFKHNVNSCTTLSSSTVNNFNNCNYFILQSQNSSSPTLENSISSNLNQNSNIINQSQSLHHESDFSTCYGCPNELKMIDSIKPGLSQSTAVSTNFYYSPNSAAYQPIMANGNVETPTSNLNISSNIGNKTHQPKIMMSLTNS